MAKTKSSRKNKKTVSKKPKTGRKSAVKASGSRSAKPKPTKSKTSKSARKRTRGVGTRGSSASSRRDPGKPKIILGPARHTVEVNSASTRRGPRGVGPDAGGQAGDIQGLPRAEDVDFESVEELVEEGQALEAGVVGGVEKAALDNADESGVPQHEPPEEKIPSYRNRKTL